MTSQEPDEPYSLQRISGVIFRIGCFVAASAAVVNPWVGKLYRGDMPNYHDVMLGYFWTAVICSALIFACSFLLSRVGTKWTERLALVVVLLSFFLLSDRLILARVGLPLWIADQENHFKHRPNSVRYRHNEWVRINQYGHHDDNFPLEKGDNEFRGLMLGDSITMGHGVLYEQTFSNQLEERLREEFGGQREVQIINAGVQGYATWQEYNSMVASLKFKPDFVAIQFCLNDLTEPFVVEKRFGGTGVHYHAVAEQSNSIVSFLVNETGYGRLTQSFLNRGKTVENERRWEVYDTKKAAESAVDDPRFSESWKVTLSYLERVYNLGKEKNIPVFLVIAPHTYQMLNERLIQPQKILTEHAAAHGVDVLDLSRVFQPKIFDDQTVAVVRDRGFSDEEIEKLYEARLEKYFLDQDHYTVEGHQVVANELFDLLKQKFKF
jgi:lysophospholipase L1-like esterase